MKKKELVEQILIILNWAQENREYRNNVESALDGVNWYLSNKLMSRVLMRLTRDRLIRMHHDVIESIY